MAMNGKDINSYRFGSGEEPTDEMLEQIMKEVAEEATASNRKATEEYFAQMQKNILEKQAFWTTSIKETLNGTK